MRAMRISNPLPTGKGFRMGRVAAIAALVVAGVVPARAAQVAVTLEVSAAQPFATVPVHTCRVLVNAGATGGAVLNAAERDGCILQWSGTTYSHGTFVSCIDHVCAQPEAFPLTYWRMTRNGSATTYGISDFRAVDGDRLGFSYTTWVSCLAPPAPC